MWKYKLSNPNIANDDKDAIMSVLDSQWLSMGPKVKMFEQLWAKKLNAKYAVAVSSGTAALHLACIAAKFKEGDEVLVPSLSFVATANAIKYTGAKPVFIDVSSYNNLIISKTEILKNINSRTKGIIIMHYGGYTYELEEIKDIARRNNLILIEDAAHALTSSINNRYLGTFGEIGCFSFYPNKNMTTGEGGMLVTNNKYVYELIRRIRSHGMTTNTWERDNIKHMSYDVDELGFNYRMDDIRASLGISQLKKLETHKRHRQMLVNVYRQQLTNINHIEIPFYDNKTISSNYIFVIRVLGSNLRNNLIDYLNTNGIQTSFHYPPIHTLELYKEDNGPSLPLTEKLTSELLTLPLHDNLNTNDIKIICTYIKKFMESKVENNYGK